MIFLKYRYEYPQLKMIFIRKTVVFSFRTAELYSSGISNLQIPYLQQVLKSGNIQGPNFGYNYIYLTVIRKMNQNELLNCKAYFLRFYAGINFSRRIRNLQYSCSSTHRRIDQRRNKGCRKVPPGDSFLGRFELLHSRCFLLAVQDTIARQESWFHYSIGMCCFQCVGNIRGYFLKLLNQTK